MKKFYTLAMVALLAAGATAAEKKSTTVGVAVNDVESQACATQMVSGNVMNSGFDSMADVTGTYKWTNSFLLSDQSGNPLSSPTTLNITVTDDKTGAVEITGWVSSQKFVVKGTVDLTEKTLSIPNKQDLGKDSGGDQTYFYLKGANSNGSLIAGATDATATVGTISGNVVTFPSMDIWAIGDYEKENLGYWSLSYQNVFTAETSGGDTGDEVEEGKWEKVGEATLIDAWITCGYSRSGVAIDPAEYPIKAELQQNKENKNIYRVWRPYHMEGWTLAAQNKSERNGQIVMDVTDPDHVAVKAGYYAGFKNSNGDFCVFGLYGWQLWIAGENEGSTITDARKQQIITFMENNDQPFDTFKNNVVTVNKSVFDYDITCTKAYSWKEPVTYVSTITFSIDPSAISEINADEQAPVKYFNLQGVEISAPETGQIVIVRQGSKVSKTIVK